MDNSMFSEMYDAIEKLFTHEMVNEEDIKSLQESIFTNIIPQFNEAIILTDILGVSRSSLFNSVNNGLIEKIKTEIESKSDKMEEKKQQKLWSKLMRSGHKYIYHPVMQPLIMHVMGKMTNVKEAYISEILKSQELYNKTPMTVLRHVWLDKSQKLTEEMDNLIELYSSNADRRYHTQCDEAVIELVCQRTKIYSTSSLDVTPYILTTIKDRKLDPQVNRIVEMIGESKELCSNIMHIFQDKYGEQRMRKDIQLMPFSAINTLRFDVITGLNDKHLGRLFDTDDLYGLIVLLNSCIRDKLINNNHAVDICKQLKEKQHLSRDLEFICADPYVLFVVATTMLQTTIDAAFKKKLPRQVSKLTFLVSLLSYGLLDFDSDFSIGRTYSSLKSPSFSTPKKRTNNNFTFENDPSSNWTKDEIVETLMLNVLPNVQLVHVSIKREHVCCQKTKVQSSMLKRNVTDSLSNSSKHAMVPSQYLGSPLGRLIIQYHCIFCLQRKEYFALKLLLTAISSNRRSDHRPTVEWRPELLQALVFGICCLQNTNEKMMVELLCLLRPVIPLTTVAFQLLYLVSVAALRDIAEIERLIDVFRKHPSIDMGSSEMLTERQLKDLVDIISKGYSKEQQMPPMTPTGNRVMMAPTPAYMMGTPSTSSGFRGPFYSGGSGGGGSMQMGMETPWLYGWGDATASNMAPPGPPPKFSYPGNAGGQK